jgi:hypothetical protein
LSIEVDNEKVGKDNEEVGVANEKVGADVEKAQDNRIICSSFSLISI